MSNFLTLWKPAVGLLEAPWRLDELWLWMTKDFLQIHPLS